MAYTILLVDDNVSDAILLSTLLIEASPTSSVVTATDGEQALDILMGRRPGAVRSPIDVVLLDLNLPKKSGIEVLAELRADPKFRELPVYILTTSSANEDRERVEALGAVSFLTKPAEYAELEAMLLRLVQVDFPKLLPLASTGARKPGPGLATTPEPHHDRYQVSSEGFRLLVEAVKDYAIFMLDTQGYILTWNEGAQRIKQYRPAEIIGKHFSTFYTPEDLRAQHPQEELRIAEKDGRYQEEGWRLRKDGSRFWANVTITAIRDAAGKFIGFGKVTRDLTERKANEEKLRESEERFRILVEGVRDYAIFMLDPAGRIVSWNTGAERAKGYKAAEILGKHISIFYTEEAKARNHADYELKLASEKGYYEEEGIRVRKDGATFWANVVITALHDPSGKLRGFAKVTRDITERKRAEQETKDLNAALEERVKQRTRELEESKRELEASRRKLEVQKEELLRSNADLRQFAYVASHDLQEPLRMVVSYLQFLQKSAGTKLDAQQTQFIDYAVGGALRMRSLIQDLLAYAKVERGSEVPTDDIALEAVVSEALLNLAAAIQESGARITTYQLPVAKADTIQMVQVFQNLIANAITYREAARAPEIHVGCKDSGNGYWTISVKDNGIGINPEYFEKIFVIFQRLHGNRDKYPGTGIGLAICKKIVERHRGSIWVESKPGEGSTFFFTLPKS